MLSVKTILDDIAAGRTTPREALVASRIAIAGADAAIGAFNIVAELPDGEPQGPLAGIALGVKDIYDTADLPTAYGSPIFAGHRPAMDAALVALAREQGGWVAGKTVTTEFAFLSPAHTRNPRNVAHTPGGSSSGSAAAVAAGMVPAAFGSQTGGSVIRPAAYCGVAGYKPSFRLAPTTGMLTFSWGLDTPGFFAASVEDVALFVDRLLGRPLAIEAVDAKSLRFGLYRSRIDADMSADMRRAVERAAERAEREGAAIVEIAEPDPMAEGRDAHGALQNFEAALALRHVLNAHRDRLSPILVEALETGRRTTPEAYDAARTKAHRARKAIAKLFDDIDVLMAPSAPGAAPAGLASTGSPAFNKLWTLTGNPCVNIPGATDAAALPLGVQIIGRFGRDRQTLSVAAWLANVASSL
ncbi:MAG: amidase [Phyllobacteriaceae bacterium]|nr:amidase [Phyllobacteriaceae bacterium]